MGGRVGLRESGEQTSMNLDTDSLISMDDRDRPVGGTLGIIGVLGALGLAVIIVSTPI